MTESQSFDIPKEAVGELSDLKDVLRSATYKPILDYEICVEEEVVNKVAPFVKNLPPPADDISRFEVRVNVVHFKTPASIPVPSESIATIVPVVIANEGAKIAGQALTEGKYWQITKEEEAEPDFYAVLVLYRKI